LIWKYKERQQKKKYSSLFINEVQSKSPNFFPQTAVVKELQGLMSWWKANNVLIKSKQCKIKINNLKQLK